MGVESEARWVKDTHKFGKKLLTLSTHLGTTKQPPPRVPLRLEAANLFSDRRDAQEYQWKVRVLGGAEYRVRVLTQLPALVQLILISIIGQSERDREGGVDSERERGRSLAPQPKKERTGKRPTNKARLKIAWQQLQQKKEKKEQERKKERKERDKKTFRTLRFFFFFCGCFCCLFCCAFSCLNI